MQQAHVHGRDKSGSLSNCFASTGSAHGCWKGTEDRYIIFGHVVSRIYTASYRLIRRGYIGATLV